MDDDPICNRCGYPMSRHEIDQFSGRQVKCPIYREELPHGLPPRLRG